MSDGDLAERVLSSVPVAIGYLDRDLKCWNLNRAAEELVGAGGRSPGDLRLSEIVGEDTETFRVIGKAIEEARPTQEIVEFTPPGHPEKSGHYLLFFLPDLDEDGAVRGAYLLALNLASATARELEAEREFGGSRRLLQAVIDNSQAAIYVKDASSRFILNNRASANLLGSEPEKMLGERDEAFMPKAMAERIYAHDREIVRTGKREEYEESILVDGEVRTYVSVKFPVLDADGQVIGVAGISTDITDRTRAARAETEARRSESARAERMALLRTIAEIGVSSVDIPEVSRRQAEALTQRLGLGAVWIGLADGAGRLMPTDAKIPEELAARLGPIDVDGPTLRARVFRTREPALIGDVAAGPIDEAAGQSFAALLDMRSSASLPLMVAGEPIGVLSLAWREPREFTAEEILMLESVASEVALGLQNARLFAAEQKAALRSAVLADVSASLASAEDMDAVLPTVLGKTALALDARGAMLADRVEGGWRTRHVYGMDIAQIGEFHDDEHSPGRVRASQTGESALIGDVTTVSEADAALGERVGYRSYVAHPLTFRDNVIGAIVYFWRGTHEMLTEDESAFVKRVAFVISAVLEEARLLDAERFARLRADKELENTQLLLKAADALARWTDLGLLLDRFLEVVAEATGRDRVVVSLWDDERREFTIASAMGDMHPPLGMAFDLEHASEPTRQAATEKRSVVVDYSVHKGLDRGPHLSKGPRLTLQVPLLRGERLIGLLSVDDPDGERGFTDREIELTEAIGSQAAVAIENARLFEAEVRSRIDLDSAVAELEAISVDSRERAELLDSVIASMTDGVAVNDADGRIVRMNEQAARLFGYGPEDLGTTIDERWSKFRVTDERGVVMASAQFPMQRALRGEVVRGQILHLSAPDRPGVWLLVSAAPVKRDGEIVSAVATFLDITIERELQQRQESLVEELAAANRELAAISQVTDVAITTLDMDDLLHALLERLCDVMNADAAVVMLAEEDRLRSRAALGLEDEVREGFTVQIGEGFAGWVAENRRARYVADARETSFVLSPHVKSRGIRTMLGVPLEVGGALLGVLHLDWVSVRPEDPREHALLRLAADRIALAIRNAQLYEERRETIRLSMALNEIDAEINSTLDFDEIMGRVVERTARVVDADMAIMFLVEEGGWRSRFSWNAPPDFVGQIYPAEQIVPHALVRERAGGVMLENDVAGNSAYAGVLVSQMRVTGVLDAALKLGDSIIGDFGLYHVDPRKRFTKEHESFLRNVASSLLMSVKNARLYAEERHVADTLQRALLSMPKSVAGVDFDCLYSSATETASVGGDFYDLFPLADGRVGWLIGDVSGKGLAASTLTSLVRDTLRAYAFDDDPPAQAVAKTNDVVYDAIASEMFMTLIFGILDPDSGRIVFCNAGHPPGLLLRSDGRVDDLSPTSPLIGAMRALAFEESEAHLGPADVMLLYTDGVIEARRDSELFGDERLRAAARRAYASATPKGLPRRVFEHVQEFTGGHSTDDVAMLAIARAKS